MDSPIPFLNGPFGVAPAISHANLCTQMLGEIHVFRNGGKPGRIFLNGYDLTVASVIAAAR